MAPTKKTVKKVAKKAVKKVVKKAVKKVAPKPRGPVIPKRIFDAVDKGIQLLDLLLGRKEWLSRMNLGDFDIKDPGTCVAGSVWAKCYDFETDDFDINTEDGYDMFCKLLELVGGEGTAARFGFNTGEGVDDMQDFQYLQDVWVRTIQHMKKRAK